MTQRPRPQHLVDALFQQAYNKSYILYACVLLFLSRPERERCQHYIRAPVRPDKAPCLRTNGTDKRNRETLDKLYIDTHLQSKHGINLPKQKRQPDVDERV